MIIVIINMKMMVTKIILMIFPMMMIVHGPNQPNDDGNHEHIHHHYHDQDYHNENQGSVRAGKPDCHVCPIGGSLQHVWGHRYYDWVKFHQVLLCFLKKFLHSVVNKFHQVLSPSFRVFCHKFLPSIITRIYQVIVANFWWVLSQSISEFHRLIHQFEHALVAYSRGLKVAPDFDGFQVISLHKWDWGGIGDYDGGGIWDVRNQTSECFVDTLSLSI